MENIQIKVGISDLNLVKPPGTIITIGLGSCIGIAIYDKILKVAGLAHIMLPDSTQFKNVTQPLKFADLAIPILLKKMEESGCLKNNLTARIAGGASMFNFSDKSMISDIGSRNAMSVRETLKKEKIPLLAEDVGGNKGRTMILDSEDGKVTIRIVGQGIITL